VHKFGQSALFIDEVAALQGGFILSTQLVENAQVEYPLLLVSLGTGVSFIKMNSRDSGGRIGGTCLGGGTIAGLASRVLPGRQLEDLLADAATGDASQIDCLVKDIYGSSYDDVGLDGDLPASSLSKAASYSGDNFAADFCRALIRMICINTAQLAVLYALQQHIRSVAFTGTLCHLESVRDEMQTAFGFWAGKNTLKMQFCELAAYTCALGGLSSLIWHNVF
jgi:type II pantothenate kinase